MSDWLRKTVAVFAAICTLFFVYWAGGAILWGLGAPDWIVLLVSMAAAVGAGRLVWNSQGPQSAGFVRGVILGGLLTGAVGFALGFFGPLLFNPGANQGPLLGLLITGPLGFVLGAVGGAVRWRLVRR